jgi:hypothetical protein
MAGSGHVGLLSVLARLSIQVNPKSSIQVLIHHQMGMPICIAQAAIGPTTLAPTLAALTLCSN